MLEIVADHVDDTFRAVYTVKFATAIYVLHAFQKKSKSGIKTSGQDLKMIQRRLKAAEADYKVQLEKGKVTILWAPAREHSRRNSETGERGQDRR